MVEGGDLRAARAALEVGLHHFDREAVRFSMGRPAVAVAVAARTPGWAWIALEEVTEARGGGIGARPNADRTRDLGSGVSRPSASLS